MVLRVHSAHLSDGAGTEYDLRTTSELVDLINRQDASVPPAVRAAAPAVERAVEAVVERLGRGGRLIYAGAGSSGRLAELDASECVATFGVDEVLAVVAGGLGAPPLEAAAAEDDREAGAADLGALSPSAADVVLGVSASGETPYVSGALEAAREAGARTIAFVCASGTTHASLADQAIEITVGPEILSGSTRLKAGTAQKLVLNTISTVAMIRLGKTYDDLMVDVRTSNEKLAARARRIVRAATGASEEEAEAALAEAEGSAKVAIVALLGGTDA